MQHKNTTNENQTTRRTFMKASSAAVVGGSVLGSMANASPHMRSVHSGTDETLKVGLVGCGGRGMGAAVNAMKADQNAKLTAMCDIFPDRLALAREQMSKRLGEQYGVDDDHSFTDFDGYKELMETDIDVVLLCTTPYFRPMQLAAAVDAGKHVFCEKPVAVDAPGVRSVMETCKLAKEKMPQLNIVSGLCWRYDLGVKATMAEVLDGAIGDITSIHENYLTGTLWHRDRKEDWTEMDYQIRNWLYFTWLSGDHIVEQHIHSLDKALWANRDVPPVKAFGLGGRQVRTDEKWGNIYDHFAVCYEWESGVKTYAYTRQMKDCRNNVEDYIQGTEGRAKILANTIETKDRNWKFEGHKPSMYDLEHQALFAAIREGRAINNGEYMCYSTLMAILGREVCYTGQEITWDEMWNSELALGPKVVDWGDVGVENVAMPGLDKDRLKGEG